LGARVRRALVVVVAVGRRLAATRDPTMLAPRGRRVAGVRGAAVGVVAGRRDRVDVLAVPLGARVGRAAVVIVTVGRRRATVGDVDLLALSRRGAARVRGAGVAVVAGCRHRVDVLALPLITGVGRARVVIVTVGGGRAAAGDRNMLALHRGARVRRT